MTASLVTQAPSRKLPIRASAAWVSASSRGRLRNPQVPLMVWTRRKILSRIFALLGSCSKRTSSTSTTSMLSCVSVRNSRSRSSMATNAFHATRGRPKAHFASGITLVEKGLILVCASQSGRAALILR